MTTPTLPLWMKCWGCGNNHDPSDHIYYLHPPKEYSEVAPATCRHCGYPIWEKWPDWWITRTVPCAYPEHCEVAGRQGHQPTGGDDTPVITDLGAILTERLGFTDEDLDGLDVDVVLEDEREPGESGGPAEAPSGLALLELGRGHAGRFWEAEEPPLEPAALDRAGHGGRHGTQFGRCGTTAVSVAYRARVLCRTAEPHTLFPPPCHRHREEARHQLRAETLLAPAASSSLVVGSESTITGGDTGGAQGGRLGKQCDSRAVQAPPASAGGTPASVVRPREQASQRLRAPAGGTS